MIDYQLEQVTSYYKSYADQYGMEYAEFLEQQVGMTEEEFVKKMTETVKQSLGQEMVLRAIAETEGVEISDEKFQEKQANTQHRWDLQTWMHLSASMVRARSWQVFCRMKQWRSLRKTPL